MSDRLATVYHGFPKADEDTALVQDALQEIGMNVSRAINAILAEPEGSA